MLIAIIGPDGCGKTTLANELAKKMRERGQEVRLFELNFGVLPRFRDILSFFLRRPVGRSHAPGEHLAGMRHAPNPPLRSITYMLWYGLDYWLGGRRYRHLINNGVVIFPRYVYDYGVQRSYSKAPNLIFKLMLLMAPRPDIIFTVRRSPEEIFNLKPELTVEEIQRQQDRIEYILSDTSRFVALDGSKGIPSTVAQALDRIREITGH